MQNFSSALMKVSALWARCFILCSLFILRMFRKKLRHGTEAQEINLSMLGCAKLNRGTDVINEFNRYRRVKHMMHGEYMFKYLNLNIIWIFKYMFQ